MTLLNDLPEDQRDTIIDRLGIDKVRAIEVLVDDTDHDLPDIGRADRVRGTPRKSFPMNRFYRACLRDMGDVEKGVKRGGPLTPTVAWLEVQRAFSEEDPTFTQKEISEAIQSFGGWEQMWKEFNSVSGMTARNRFKAAYKDIIEKTIK